MEGNGCGVADPCAFTPHFLCESDAVGEGKLLGIEGIWGVYPFLGVLFSPFLLSFTSFCFALF